LKKRNEGAKASGQSLVNTTTWYKLHLSKSIAFSKHHFRPENSILVTGNSVGAAAEDEDETAAHHLLLRTTFYYYYAVHILNSLLVNSEFSPRKREQRRKSSGGRTRGLSTPLQSRGIRREAQGIRHKAHFSPREARTRGRSTPLESRRIRRRGIRHKA
jgi:hypothetical protein